MVSSETSENKVGSNRGYGSVRNGRADCEIWSEIAGFSIRMARLRRLRLAAWRRLDPRSRRLPSPVDAEVVPETPYLTPKN